MTFTEIIRQVEIYLRMEGSKTEYMIKQFVNDSVVDFIRLRDWERMKVSDTITLDDSDEYELDNTNLSYNFEREISLIVPYSESVVAETSQRTEYNKYDYHNYLQLTSKDYAWSVFGTKLYVGGTGVDLTLTYMSPGDFDNYPLTDDDNEVAALTYYSDIIQKMAVIKFLDSIKEDSASEQQLLGRKLISLKNAENRARNSGKFKMVQRGGLG